MRPIFGFLLAGIVFGVLAIAILSPRIDPPSDKWPPPGTSAPPSAPARPVTFDLDKRTKDVCGQRDPNKPSWVTAMPMFCEEFKRHQKLVAEGKIERGMLPDEVKLAWGEPARIEATESAYGKREVWYYRNKVLVFEGWAVLDLTQIRSVQ